MGRRWEQAAAALAAMLFATVGVAAPAASQTATDEGVWTAVSLRGKVTDDAAWRWSADAFVQSRDGVRTLDLVLGHAMVTRDVGRRVKVGAGYAVGVGFRNSGTLLEHRLTQLVTWSSGARTRVSLRTLLEERFVTGREAMWLRARQQVRVAWPIGAQRRLWGVVSEELLVQADGNALSSPRLDGNRSFVGIGRTLAPGSVAEIGYLHVYASAGSNRHQSSHILLASVAMSWPQGTR